MICLHDTRELNNAFIITYMYLPEVGTYSLIVVEELE